MEKRLIRKGKEKIIGSGPRDFKASWQIGL